MTDLDIHLIDIINISLNYYWFSDTLRMYRQVVTDISYISVRLYEPLKVNLYGMCRKKRGKVTIMERKGN